MTLVTYQEVKSLAYTHDSSLGKKKHLLMRLREAERPRGRRKGKVEKQSQRGPLAKVLKKENKQTEKKKQGVLLLI